MASAFIAILPAGSLNRMNYETELKEARGVFECARFGLSSRSVSLTVGARRRVPENGPGHAARRLKMVAADEGFA